VGTGSMVVAGVGSGDGGGTEVVDRASRATESKEGAVVEPYPIFIPEENTAPTSNFLFQSWLWKIQVRPSFIGLAPLESLACQRVTEVAGRSKVKTSLKPSSVAGEVTASVADAPPAQALPTVYTNEAVLADWGVGARVGDGAGAGVATGVGDGVGAGVIMGVAGGTLAVVGGTLAVDVASAVLVVGTGSMLEGTTFLVVGAVVVTGVAFVVAGVGDGGGAGPVERASRETWTSCGSVEPV
jgi:hypothetical protein